MICRRSVCWRLPLVNIVLWCAFAVRAQSLEVPFLAGRVNDTAHILSDKTIYALEDLLKAHEDSTSNQVVVLTIPSLQGEPLEEYSIKVVDTWKLGHKDQDNGVLLLIVRDDRKVRIEVGNGLEGDLPDITCGHIIRNEIVPRFRNSDYEGGIRAGVNAILGAINGSYKADESRTMASPDFLFFGIFLIVVGLFTTIAVFLQGAVSWILYAFLIPFWAAFPMVSLGVKIGAILLAIYLVGFPLVKLWFAKTKKGQALAKKWSIGASTGGTNLRDGLASRGRRDSSGSSGWSSGGSSGGFSGGGSSFSGGGGSFSGGGASGSW
jgi:uncharacterized protein